MKVVRYESGLRDCWNNFIKNSKNGYFFFYREYMEYHHDRFLDYSLLFYDNENLIAVLPANINNQSLISHGGLTFGGVISNLTLSTLEMLKIFETLINYLKLNGVKKLIYKTMPYIYTTIASQEDLYALFRYDAKLIRRDVSSTIFLKDKLKFSKGKKFGVSKASKLGLNVLKSIDYKTFMEIQNKVLEEKYNVQATHSAEELASLASKFPENIKLYCTFKGNEMVAGIVIFEYKELVHTQYMAASSLGQQLGALDLLVDVLINKEYSNKYYFNFGISTEKNGTYLNEGLIRQKEMFGARATVYDMYEIEM